jgi:hypothetical protein
VAGHAAQAGFELRSDVEKKKKRPGAIPAFLFDPLSSSAKADDPVLRGFSIPFGGGYYWMPAFACMTAPGSDPGLFFYFVIPGLRPRGRIPE